MVQFRPARRTDVPGIVALLADDALGRRREQYEDPLPPEYLAAFDAIERDPNNLLAVGVDGASVVATLQLTFIPSLTFRGGWRMQIEAVRVAESHRGSGLGRRLVEWSIDQARQRSCHLVQLTTNKQRTQARRFYESLGFEATHHGMKLYLRDPEIGGGAGG